MKTTLLTAVALLALAGPALAQAQTDHQQHHSSGSPQTQAQSQAPTQPQGQMPMGQMMQGMPGMMRGTQGQGAAGAGGRTGMMMNCPMMQGGMAGMMGGRGMGAMAGAARQGGDESVPSLAFRAVNDKMHRDMAIELTGNVDVDFARAMIAHHQGAIDMAKVALAFGKDPDVRKLAEEVVRTQEVEIATMREWLAKQPK